MSGTTSSLFRGQAVPPQPTGSDTSTAYPQWLQQYVYNLGSAATNLADSPYQAFTGQQVATPSSQTQQAWTQAGNNIGSWQPNIAKAGALTTDAATPLTASDINQYVNPYIDTVLGGLADASNRNFNTNVLPGIQDRFVSAGQSRSPQEARITTDAVYNQQQALDQAQAGALTQAYQGGTNTALAQQQAKQTGGAQLGQLGALTQQLGAADVGQLAASGQSQDTVNQANLNAAQNNFYQQQQWPYQNLAFASNIIRGQPVNANTQVVGQQYNPGQAYTSSPLSTFAGTAAGASALGLAKGGSVGGALSRLAAKGRNGDTELAHVNPEEAALLHAMGGSGTVNPRTGLREYYDVSPDMGTGDRQGVGTGGFGNGPLEAGTGGAPRGDDFAREFGYAPANQIDVPKGDNFTEEFGYDDPNKSFLDKLVAGWKNSGPSITSPLGLAMFGLGAALPGAGLAMSGTRGVAALASALGGKQNTVEQTAANTAANNAAHTGDNTAVSPFWNVGYAKGGQIKKSRGGALTWAA
jgi:hypothetical protein